MPTHTGSPPRIIIEHSFRFGTESGNPNHPVTETGNPPSIRLVTETGNPALVARVGQCIQITSEQLGNFTIRCADQTVIAQLRDGNLFVAEGEDVTHVLMAGSFQSVRLDRDGG